MPASLDIDWTKIRDVNDVILPVAFTSEEGGSLSPPWQWLGYVDHGSRVVDRLGNRFLVMGHGSVQGSVILRDRYRRMFHADIDQWLKVVAR